MAEKRLEIHAGVPPIPGDTNTNEPQFPPIILAGSSDGFMLPSGDWKPERARLKSGGTYIDAPGIDGSYPQDFAYANVQEVIELNLTISGGDMDLAGVELDARIAELQRYIDMAQNFSTTYWQTTPVYLLYKDYVAEPQYSLIYAGDVEVQKTGVNTATVTLRITREPYWYEDPPFSNPKLRSLRVNDVLPTPTNVSLISGSDDLIIESISNRTEFDSTDYAGDPLSKNWIDIDGDLITGDVPALVQIGVTGTPRNLILGVSSKPVTGVDNSGNAHRNAYNLNAGDVYQTFDSVLAPTVTFTKTSGVGVISNYQNALNYAMDVALQAGLSNKGYFYWGGKFQGAITDPPYILSMQLLRGRYAVFLRGGLIGTPVANSVRASVRYAVSAMGNPADEKIGDVTFGSGENYLNYVGEVEIPFGKRSATSVDGNGIEVATDPYSDISFTVGYFSNSAGSTQTVRIIDLILMPIDEANSLRRLTGQSSGGTYTILDSTGYVSRDPSNRQVTISNYFLGGGVYQNGIGGADLGLIELKPNVDQRIYILSTDNGNFADETADYDVYVNLKPRWLGIRGDS